MHLVERTGQLRTTLQRVAAGLHIIDTGQARILCVRHGVLTTYGHTGVSFSLHGTPRGPTVCVVGYLKTGQLEGDDASGRHESRQRKLIEIDLGLPSPPGRWIDPRNKRGNC